MEIVSRSVLQALARLHHLQGFDVGDEEQAPMFAYPFTFENLRDLAIYVCRRPHERIEFGDYLTAKYGHILVMWNSDQMSEATMRRRIGAYIN